VNSHVTYKGTRKVGARQPLCACFLGCVSNRAEQEQEEASWEAYMSGWRPVGLQCLTHPKHSSSNKPMVFTQPTHHEIVSAVLQKAIRHA
jgi:hypothetical protein